MNEHERIELNTRLDYCDEQVIEMCNHLNRDDFAQAADALEKAINQYQLCLHDLRKASPRNGG